MEENLEDLKRKAFNLMDAQEMPEKIRTIAREIFGKLNDLLSKLGVNNANIKEYLSGNNIILEGELNAVFKTNNFNKAEDVIHLMDKLEVLRDEEENKEKSQETDKENLGKAVNNRGLNDSIAERMIELTNDSIANSRNMIMRYLESNNTSRAYIEKIDEYINMFKEAHVNSKQKDILNALNQQDKNILANIVETYDTVIGENVKSDEHKKFVERYASPIDRKMEQEIIEKNLQGKDENEENLEEDLTGNFIL